MFQADRDCHLRLPLLLPSIGAATMGDEFAHTPIHKKLEQELNSAFADVSSDEEPIDDREYEAPHEKGTVRTKQKM